MTLGGCFRFGVAILALEMMLTVAYCSASRLNELASIAIGDYALAHSETKGRVLARAKAIIAAVDSTWPEAAPRQEGDDLGATSPAQRGSDRLVGNAIGLLRLVAVRMAIAEDVMFPALACLVAAAIDGLAIRRRRAFTFATTSTVLYNAAGYGVLLSVLVPAICLAAPARTAMAAMPAVALGMALAIWTFFAYLPGAGPLIGLRT